jgi:precorrin-2 dehydrogenase/sirohydrochlorin ferrochelatase
MRYYPLLLDLTKMRCLVVGAGEVGLRKIQGLLPCSPAAIVVVDPGEPGPELAALLASHGNLTYERRPFADTDTDGVQLVFACTSNREVNALVGEICRSRGVLCNMTDDPISGSFALPASITRGDLTITVSTGGSSPALARVIRQDLERTYGEEYEAMTRLLADIRSALLALGGSSGENRVIFRALATSPLAEMIKTNDRAACLELLQSVLPAPLHPRIGDWCDDCFPTV